MRTVLRERYTVPEIDFPMSQYRERTDAEAKKASALKTLDDPEWLPNILTRSLQNPNIDWETKGDRVKHALAKFSKFVSILKRKTESSLHSEGPRKASRTSGQSTPQDNR
ncbi:hypothetical protein C0993_011131, partial [Termitomyces sp. T159_Od127]